MKDGNKMYDTMVHGSISNIVRTSLMVKVPLFLSILPTTRKIECQTIVIGKERIGIVNGLWSFQRDKDDLCGLDGVKLL